MSDKVLHLRDDLPLGDLKPALHADSLNFLNDAKKSTIKPDFGLAVTIRASHSGYLVNNRVYPGVHMREAVSSWTVPYPRPVLTNHNEHSDPIGRIYSAEFTQIKKGSGFDNDFRRPATSGMGSGFVTIETAITDFDAIEKILDGRFYTVSSSQTTTEATCSICNIDKLGPKWMDCNHWPGEIYEIVKGKGKNAKTVTYKCFIITGPLTYRECSYVNVPAQPNASTIETTRMGDSLEDALIISAIPGHAELTSVTLRDCENTRELLLVEGAVADSKKAPTVMIEMVGLDEEDAEEIVIEEKENDTLDADADEGETAISETEEVDHVEFTSTDLALANVARSIRDAGGLIETNSEELQSQIFDGACAEANDHTHDCYVEALDNGRFVGRTYSTVEGTVDHEHVIEGSFDIKDESSIGETRSASSGPDHTHTFELPKIAGAIPDMEKIQSLMEILDTAVEDEDSDCLNEEQRELLAKKTFCGPNRSFPVPDADHVIASRLLIARSKGNSEIKARILNKLDSEAEKLGYDRKAADTENAEEGTETKKTETIAQSNDASLRVLVEQLSHTSAELESSKTKVIAEERVSKDRLEEVERLTDALADANKECCMAFANSLAIVNFILAKPDTIGISDSEGWQEYVEGLSTRTADSLRDAINDHFKELDIELRNRRGGIHKRLLTPEEKPLTQKDDKKAPAGRVDRTNKPDAITSTEEDKRSGAEKLFEDLS